MRNYYKFIISYLPPPPHKIHLLVDESFLWRRGVILARGREAKRGAPAKPYYTKMLRTVLRHAKHYYLRHKTEIPQYQPMGPGVRLMLICLIS
jgi:hypothetical protein